MCRGPGQRGGCRSSCLQTRRCPRHRDPGRRASLGTTGALPRPPDTEAFSGQGWGSALSAGVTVSEATSVSA